MKELKQRLSLLIQSEEDTQAKLQKICTLLDQEIEYFNWTGFYFRDGDKEELVLGPYVGATTDHIRIPFGKGICGQVAVSGETFLVPDVYAQDNYLSCSLDTQSEIVVPIFKNGKNIGQIDIDSHHKDPFSQEDQQLLEWLCEEVGKLDF
ncbi:GAF domain-containing protein [Elizabethkingia sp. JS20170427COW]|uniref:GAF domain-containing protein n=1 Tax=Elizabethkingia sp. JS20170427COW TaxID=2583851 RepID=UPI00111014AB|nr:GAF domain-containing protein [Elizabethkingia sp. JS20170427COW]QCX52533.1 GAF domain-containing protein [Elizabethkingia sp. JS20170427COW]